MKAELGIFLSLIFLLPSCGSRSPTTSRTTGDLSPANYTRIEHALDHGDITRLPKCTAHQCNAAMDMLVKSASLRVQWHLKQSLKYARLCVKAASDHFLGIYYSCARLVAANASSADGFYGRWKTFPVLNRAVLKACSHHLWGTPGPCESGPVAREAKLYESLRPLPEHLTFIKSSAVIPLIGKSVQKVNSFGKLSYLEKGAPVTYPAAYIYINGKKFLMTIDIGDQTTLLYSKAAKIAGISVIKGIKVRTTGFVGQVNRPGVGRADEIKFGNIVIRNQYVHIINGPEHGRVAGLIGFDLISRLKQVSFYRDRLVIGRSPQGKCNGRISIVSNFHGRVFGVRPLSSSFNGVPVVTVFDSGNADSPASASWQFVKKGSVRVGKPYRIISGGLGDKPTATYAADIKGKLRVFSKYIAGKFIVSGNFPESGVDFNVGAPFIYKHGLYLNFMKMKSCFLYN